MMKLRTCLSLNRASGGPQCGSFQRHGPDLIGSNLGKQAFRHLAFGFPRAFSLAFASQNCPVRPIVVAIQ